MTAAVNEVLAAKAAAEQPIPKKRATKKRPAKKVDSPLPDGMVESPYPDGVHVFAYQPQDGSAPILLAIDGFQTPDKLWHFDNAQLPPLAQRWNWMDLANIPKTIQRRAHTLPDAEFFKMFNDWFDVMAKARGVMKGSVTPGK